MLASLSQLATESWAYFSASASSGTSNGSATSGCCLSVAMCSHQTPRGRRISMQNRRTSGSASPVCRPSSARAASRCWARRGRRAIQAHSRTPKCSSRAKRNCASRASSAGCERDRYAWANAAQLRTVSDGCVQHCSNTCWRNDSAACSSHLPSARPMSATFFDRPSAWAWSALAARCSTNAAGSWPVKALTKAA
ncbi:hypothetical protein D3C76_1273470 [compost metagenome]